MAVFNRVFLEKVTLNIGVGESGAALEAAKTLLKNVSGLNPVQTLAKDRNPTFKIRKGDAIGAKITLRGKKAEEVLTRALQSVDKIVSSKSFDDNGNVSFGIKEYIDFPGLKYDPKIGMMGFDVCLSLRKKGLRVSQRRIAKKKLPRKQRVSSAEAKAFLEKTYGVSIAGAA
ncbi:MAG TPA: 50S ribosomal protein L5 [Candidatus Norongarragalinales archaeon]|nr:50S ribosomal protein L5 [Candidatus Norongarragalinales archaeon]